MPTTTRGIWTPDSGDDYALTTDLAATAASIDQAITDATAETIETVAELEAVKFTPVTGITPLNGFTINPATRAAKIGSMVLLTIEATRSVASGGIAAVEFATLPTSLRPTAPVTAQFVASQGTGASSPSTVVINPDGKIRNWTANPTNGLISGSILWGV